MDRLTAQVEAEVRRRQLLRDGEPLLLAVSGGLDSMVLLHVIHTLAPTHQWKISTAHFHHGLRGRASDADQRLVETVSARLGCERCLTARGEVKTLAQAEGLSVEMAARRLRHAFLARSAQELGIGSVLLAHHADDQIELFFLRLFRGAGAAGLAGMRWKSPSPAAPRITLVRPLLGVARAELERYAAEQNVEFRQDQSNWSRQHLRNRVRHELLPWLQRHFPSGWSKTVPRSMEVLGAESECLDQLARAWLDQPASQPWARLHPALQRRVLQTQLLARGLEPEFDLIEGLRCRPGHSFEVSPGRFLAWSPEKGVSEVRPEAFVFQQGELRIETAAGRGGGVFGGGEFQFETGRRSAGEALRRTRGAAQECFDADRVGPVICLRHWRPGDRFQPIGLPQAAKLQDLFVNLKVPRAERTGRVLATTLAGEIFWVEGLRIGEHFKLDKQTRLCIKWRWRRVGQAVAPTGASC